jgi:hypothetical protein
MLYIGDKPAKLFRGNYQPVNLYLGDKKLAGYDYQTKTGQAVSFEGTYNDTAEITVFGKSEQVQTVQEKNLIDYKKAYNGFETTVTIIDNGLQLNGKWYVRIPVKNIVVGSSYTLSWLFEVLSGTPNTKWGLYYEDGTNSVQVGQGSSRIAEKAVKEIYLYVAVGTTASGNFTNIQLELGSVATAYAPFVPNSPSPDYPSPISCISSANLYGCGKNFLDCQQTWTPVKSGTGTITDITANVGEIIYTANGQLNSSRVCSPAVYLSAGTYYIKAIRGLDKTGNIAVYSLTDNSPMHYETLLGTLIASASSRSFILTKSAFVSIFFYCVSAIYDVPTEIKFSNIMLSKEDIPYEPFVGSQKLALPFNSPIYSLPNGIADKGDLINGKERHDIGIKILKGDGTEGWVAGSDNGTQAYNRFEIAFPDKLQIADNVSNTLYCNYFRQYNYSGTTGIYPMIADRPSTNIISFRIDKSIADVISFKAFLANLYALGTPVIVVYQKSTPTEYTLSLPEQPKTFYPFTQFYTDTAANIEVKAKVMD